MGVLFHGRYNRNDLRNFPLADAAGRTAVGGGILPADFLADLSLRYPLPADGAPGVVYVAWALRTPNLAGVALALRTAAGDAPLATVLVGVQ